MAHPIWGKPQHQLLRVTFTLELPTSQNGRTTRLIAVGSSETARASMWVVRETWSPSEQEAGLQPADALHHVALVALQDHPTSQTQMEACLIGEGWEQLQLDL